MHGTLPSTLGNLAKNIMWMQFQENMFSGTIPTTVSKLPKLVVFNVGKNHLTGPVVSLFDPSTQVELTQVLMHGNQLTGNNHYFDSYGC